MSGAILLAPTPAPPHITIDARMVRISGIGTYIEEIVPRVIALWRDASFTILGDQDVLVHTIPPSPRVRFRALDAKIYSIREQLALVRAVPRETSLLWVPHYNIPLLYRGAIAVTVHDVFHLAFPDESRLKRWYATAMFGAVVRRARLVMCDSQFTAGELARLAGSPATLAVVHLGVSSRWSRLGRRTAPPAAPYFLAVGNVKPHKNLKRLVQAFELVASAVPHRLVIVGRREGLITSDREVEALAERLGDRVQFTGYVGREQLEKYVAGCAALIQPSLYEGFGLPPLEAMAAGRPAAVARAGSLPEVCGPEADYFDPLDIGDIAAALLRQAHETHDSEAAPRRQQWAKAFDWDRCALTAKDLLARAACLPSAAA